MLGVLVSLVVVLAGGIESGSGVQSTRVGPVAAPSVPFAALSSRAPASSAMVALGRALFFARELSVDTTVSCADCHRPELAFTDGRARALGVGGIEHQRSAMSLSYAAWAPSLGWAHHEQRELEQQVLTPLLSPGEMGLLGSEDKALARLTTLPWRERFRAAFADESPSLERIARALAAFQRTLGRFDSPFDRWMLGEGELDPAAREGFTLFFSRELGCGSCHGGLLFAGPIRTEQDPEVKPLLRRTGLLGEDTGLERVTGREQDRFVFRVPTLRNVAVTAPYFHDGRLRTLDEVLDFYSAGPAHLDPGAEPSLTGFELSGSQRRALIAFLRSLTDAGLASGPTLVPCPECS